MQHLSYETDEPLNEAAISEMEAYVSEALTYRHVPEFAGECARLLAEVRRLRAALGGAEDGNTSSGNLDDASYRVDERAA